MKKHAFRITMENSGGVIDQRFAADECDALVQFRLMVDQLGLVADGDVFRITEGEFTDE